MQSKRAYISTPWKYAAVGRIYGTDAGMAWVASINGNISVSHAVTRVTTFVVRNIQHLSLDPITEIFIETWSLFGRNY